MAEQEEMKNEEKGGGSRNKKILIVTVIAVAAVIVVLVGIIIYLVNGRDEDESKREVIVTTENADALLEELFEEQETELEDPGHYTVAQNFGWIFPNSKSASVNAKVHNDESNSTPVYFDMVLEEDESVVLFESPVIPVGGSLEEIVLNQDLEPGTYNCVMIYHLVDENQNTLSTVRLTNTITIEN